MDVLYRLPVYSHDVDFKDLKEKEGGYMFCTKCGNQLPEDSGFCQKCGVTIDLGKAEMPVVNRVGIILDRIINNVEVSPMTKIRY